MSCRISLDIARASEETPDHHELPANTNRAAMRTHNLYFTEISEKGKPSERVGRKAKGSKTSRKACDDSPAANISIILIFFKL